jgi:hypothetical protein
METTAAETSVCATAAEIAVQIVTVRMMKLAEHRDDKDENRRKEPPSVVDMRYGDRVLNVPLVFRSAG